MRNPDKGGAAESEAGGARDGLTCFLETIKQLPEPQQQAVLRHVNELARKSPEKLAAILALLKD